MCCCLLLLLLFAVALLSKQQQQLQQQGNAKQTKKLCSRARRCCALLPLLAEGGVGAHAAPRGTNPHTTTRPACGRALARSRRRLHGDVRCLLCSARAEQAAPLTSTKNPFEPLARMCAPLAGRTHEKNQNQNITRSDGCLGSCTDEERSKLRYVV